MPGKSGSEYYPEVVEWTNWNDETYIVPTGDTIRDHTDPRSVQGVHVHAYNVDDPNDEHWFWVWSYLRLNWQEWDDIIASNMDMHNMALA